MPCTHYCMMAGSRYISWPRVGGRLLRYEHRSEEAQHDIAVFGSILQVGTLICAQRVFKGR